MIQFNFSQTLAEPLTRFVKPGKHVEADLIFRAEMAQVGSETCIVLEEQHSRYIMVLNGLGKGDFTHFPKFFRQRFWREATAICKRFVQYDTATLAKYLNIVAKKQSYIGESSLLQNERLEAVIEEFRHHFLKEGKELPMDGKSVFEFSFAINSRPQESSQDNTKTNAVDAFADICLKLIEETMEKDEDEDDFSEGDSENKVVATDSNVVKVNFTR